MHSPWLLALPLLYINTSNAQTTTTAASGYFPGQYPLTEASGYIQADACEQNCMSEDSKFDNYDEAHSNCQNLLNLLYDVAPCLTQVCSRDSVAVYDVQTVLASYCTSLASSATAPAPTFSIPVVIPTAGVVVSVESSSSSVAATSSSTASTSTTASSLVTTSSSTPSAAPSTTNNRASLSTGAEAGIGVGVAVAGIAIIALAFVFWRRRKTSKGQQRDVAPTELTAEEKAEMASPDLSSPGEKLHELQDSGLHEVYTEPKPLQAGDGRAPAELEGGSHV